MRVLLGLITLLLWVLSCTGPSSEETNTGAIRLKVPSVESKGPVLALDKETYEDKVLGAIVGSAIGDAMGASTEMWHRKDIQREYGYITGLTTVNLSRQAEGPWGNLAGKGTTTDDTRWKFFLGKYFAKYGSDLHPDHFAQMIVNYYQQEVKGLANSQLSSSPDRLDDAMLQVDWIKEWARVALAYQKGAAAFETAKSRFYGGEMSCAGMLYTPMFGLITPQPDSAYKLAYHHALFDIGYAKDIAGMVATFTHLALQENNMQQVLEQGMRVDPFGYSNSRLVGRLMQNIVKESRWMVQTANSLSEDDLSNPITAPKGYPGSQLDWNRQAFIYDELAKKQRAIAFHAGEIFQILYTALLYGEGDLNKTMAFIVNYGRDNDTVGAVAGMILGAQLGFKRLPIDLRNQVMQTNKVQLGIDLETVGQEVIRAGSR